MLKSASGMLTKSAVLTPRRWIAAPVKAEPTINPIHIVPLNKDSPELKASGGTRSVTSAEPMPILAPTSDWTAEATQNCQSFVAIANPNRTAAPAK